VRKWERDWVRGNESDLEASEVTTIVTDNKRPPDRKSDTWSQNVLFLSDLSDLGDLSDFEVFDVTMIVTDNKRLPDRKSDTWSRNSLILFHFLAALANILMITQRFDRVIMSTSRKQQ
jgi:hypothetical protein